MSVLERAKRVIARWLGLQLQEQAVVIPTIVENSSHALNAMRNRIWYRGDPSELDQFFHQTTGDMVSQMRFWAQSPSSHSSGIRKMHSGLPGMVVNILADVVVTDMLKVDFGKNSDQVKSTWQKIEEANEFKRLITQAVQEVLVVGDGAFKISLDPDVDDHPIIEFVPGDRVRFVRTRGRIEEVHFHSVYAVKDKQYILVEKYGKGYVDYHLTNQDGTADYDMSEVPELAGLARAELPDDMMMAVPILFYPSPRWAGRGRSIYDLKNDAFDALDETISQWQDAIRLGRVMRYIPEAMIPRDPETGKMMRVNPMDNVYTALRSIKSEDSESRIQTDQPQLQYEGYLGAYMNNLDLALQGIISPSTLGIDTKKLDNAEAQREKEKATLYTRDKIIDVLGTVIPQLIEVTMQAYHASILEEMPELTVTVEFGEYANPSFEAQIEVIAKASMSGVMSIQAQVETLWGDTKDEEWKRAEIARIKADRGIMEMEEPQVAPHGFKREMMEIYTNDMDRPNSSDVHGDGDVSVRVDEKKPQTAHGRRIGGAAEMDTVASNPT